MFILPKIVSFKLYDQCVIIIVHPDLFAINFLIGRINN